MPKDGRDNRHVNAFEQQDGRGAMPCAMEAEVLLYPQSVSDPVKNDVGPGIRRQSKQPSLPDIIDKIDGSSFEHLRYWHPHFSLCLLHLHHQPLVAIDALDM